MRRIFLIFLGAIAGAGLTLLATQPLTVLVGSSAKAASSDTYRQLNLFGEVFERVRANYVEKPDDSKLVESAINGIMFSLKSIQMVQGSVCIGLRASCRVCARPSSKPSI
jgi:carboxyl-terminal processing protease